MTNGFELFGYGASNALTGRVGLHKLREGLLELNEFFEQLVEGVIADFGPRLVVIQVVVPVEFLHQLVDSFLCLIFRYHGGKGKVS